MADGLADGIDAILKLHPQERHAGSRLDQRKKERAAKEAMAGEMAAKEAADQSETARKAAAELAVRQKQRSAIATPGRTPSLTPRRAKLGL